MNRPEPHPEDRSWTFYEKDPVTTFYKGFVPGQGHDCILMAVRHHDRAEDDPEASWWTVDRTIPDGSGYLNISGWTSDPADARRQAEAAYRRLGELIKDEAAAVVEHRGERPDGGTMEKLSHEGETIYRFSYPNRNRREDLPN